MLYVSYDLLDELQIYTLAVILQNFPALVKNLHCSISSSLVKVGSSCISIDLKIAQITKIN